jgi:hypothetical protein
MALSTGEASLLLRCHAPDSLSNEPLRIQAEVDSLHSPVLFSGKASPDRSEPRMRIRQGPSTGMRTRQGPSGRESIGCGLLMLAVGGLATLLGYWAASDNGYYVFTIGLFIAGGLSLLRGLWKLAGGDKLFRRLLGMFVKFED